MTIRLDAVLHAVKLPASISHLNSGLSDMHRNTFPHDDWKLEIDECKKDRLSRSIKRTDKLLKTLMILLYVYSYSLTSLSAIIEKPIAATYIF